MVARELSSCSHGALHGRLRVMFSRVWRMAVAIGLTAVVLSHADAASVLRTLDGARVTPLAAAVVMVMVDRALMGWRWVALLGAVDAARRPALGPAMRLFFVSTFLGTFLPTSIGSDTIRAVGAAKLGVLPGEAAASVVLDRLVGVVGILVLAAIGLVLGRELASDSMTAFAFAFACTLTVSALGTALIFSDSAATIARGFVRAVPGTRLPTFVVDLIGVIQRHRAHRKRLAIVLAASIAVQLLRVMQAWALGLALRIPAEFTMYLTFVPVILLIMLLPVTVSGIGTSQAGFVWLFGAAGIDPAAAFALSVLFLALGIVGNLPGALLFVSAPTKRHDGGVPGHK